MERDLEVVIDVPGENSKISYEPGFNDFELNINTLPEEILTVVKAMTSLISDVEIDPMKVLEFHYSILNDKYK